MNLAGDGWSVEQADSLQWLQDPGDRAGTVDAFVTDPPYSSGGALRTDRTNATTLVKYRATGASLLPEFTGDNRDQRSFTLWCSLWMAAARPWARPGGSLCCFADWRQLPAVSDALQAGGWVWRGVAVWRKPAHRARPVAGGFWNDTEFILWGTNGPLDTARWDRCLPGVFEGAAPAEKVHITEKPLEVLEQVVEIAPPGGLIVDPFAGSGTTGVAALRQGRRFMGVEYDRRFVEVSAARCWNTQRMAPLDAPPEAVTLWGE